MQMLRHTILIAMLCACGKSSSTPTPGSTSGSPPAAGSGAGALAEGKWTGTWKRSIGGGGTLELVVGATTTFKRIGTMCPPEETPATVTVVGDKVSIDVATPDVTATYSGTRAGKKITGDLVTTCKLGGAPTPTTGNGTFELTAP